MAYKGVPFTELLGYFSEIKGGDMGNKMKWWKNCFKLDDRRLHVQKLFWMVTVLPTVALFGAAARVLSEYEFDSSGTAVRTFFYLIYPLVPWLAFIAALAALIARMHATVQTEVQIDAARRATAFSQYLEHSRHVGQALEHCSALNGRTVDRNKVYRRLFPNNSHKALSLSSHREGSDGKNHIEWMEEHIVKGFENALVKRGERRSLEQWKFEFIILERYVVTVLDETGIGTLESEEREADDLLNRAIPVQDKLDIIERRLRAADKIIQELAYIGGASRSNVITSITNAIAQLRVHDGEVDAKFWKPFDYSLEKYAAFLDATTPSGAVMTVRLSRGRN